MADKWIGTITSVGGAAKDNSTTAVAFTIPTSAKLTLQPDVDCYVKFHETASEAAVTSANGLRIPANVAWTTSAPSRGSGIPATISNVPSARLSVLPVTASPDVNLKVFERQGNEN